MLKGKHPFTAPPENEPLETPCETYPQESDYYVKPSPGRRQLTPRDLAHNQKVRTLFNNLRPGLPIDNDPPETRHDPEPFSALIEKTLKKLKINQSPWLEQLHQAWPRLLPPEITKIAQPGKWDNGILYIYVPSSIQLFELRRCGLKQIEAAVQTFAGDHQVKQVRLMVNSINLPS